jgi:hypothetical protein
VDVWDRCKRRWSYEYIWKIRTPQHPAAVLGGETHGHLESWLDRSTPPPFDVKSGAIAIHMIKNCPLPGTGVVERRFWFRTPLGHVYTGFIDWSGWWNDNGAGLWMPTVLDHKTSGNLNWAKTEEELHNDIQAVLYSVVAFIGFNTDTLRLFWNYGETKLKMKAYATKTVKTVVHLPVVMAKFNNVIEPEAAQMIAHREAGTDPMTFPVSPQSCGDFGGCPHKNRCNLSPMAQLGGTMTGQQPTMQQRMAALPTNGTAMNQPQLPAQPTALPGMQQPAALPGQPAAALPGHQVNTAGAATVLPGQQPTALPGQQPAALPVNLGSIPGQQPAALPGQQPAALPGQGPGQMAPAALPGQGPGQMAPAALPGQGPGQMAPAALPGAQQPAALPGVQQPAALPGQQQAAPPQQAYAPDVAPNPPESTQAQPPAEDPAKGKPGRPPGARNKAKTLTVEQQVYMGGVYAAMGIGNVPTENLATAGEAALTVFNTKFG